MQQGSLQRLRLHRVQPCQLVLHSTVAVAMEVVGGAVLHLSAMECEN
jgi:hypothetical protein